MRGSIIEVAKDEKTMGGSVMFRNMTAIIDKHTLLYNPRTDDLRLSDSQPDGNTVAMSRVSQGGTTSRLWKQGDIVYVLEQLVYGKDLDITNPVVV